MGSLPVEVALSLLYLLVCPALGAAECRSAAVHSLSPACIRHPGRAGTDPDTCHQRSTGTCPSDAGPGLDRQLAGAGLWLQRGAQQ